MMGFSALPWRGAFSLRVRLAGSMVLVLVLALAVSAALDQRGGMPGLTPRWLDLEPYQDSVVLACFSIAALLLIWLVSWWSLRPLDMARLEAASVGPQHPGRRLTTTHLPAEITPLLGAVNHALDRLESAYEAERRFTADAAHELRTPLSVLSLRLQRARLDGDVDWEAVDGDLRQMTRLVTQLLDLARKEQEGRVLAGTQVNLSRVAREAAAMILPLAEAAGREVLVELPACLPVCGRPEDLRDAVLVLLENALTHGMGRIAVQGSQDDAFCHVSVADEGPGVPAPLREAMFQRFQKMRQGSGGTGLGLAILRQVVESHGGRVAFADTDTCRVQMTVPARQPHS